MPTVTISNKPQHQYQLYHVPPYISEYQSDTESINPTNDPTLEINQSQDRMPWQNYYLPDWAASTS